MFRELAIKIKLLKTYKKKTWEIFSLLSDKEVAYCLILYRVVSNFNILFVMDILWIVQFHSSSCSFCVMIMSNEIQSTKFLVCYYNLGSILYFSANWHIVQGIRDSREDASYTEQINSDFLNWRSLSDDARKSVFKRVFSSFQSVDLG